MFINNQSKQARNSKAAKPMQIININPDLQPRKRIKSKGPDRQIRINCIKIGDKEGCTC